MKKIGIMGALPEEIDRIAASLTNSKQEEYAGVVYKIGSYAGKQAVVCSAGMGKANAASVTQVLITKYGVDCLLFSGIAGNMSQEIGIGDVVVGQTLCYHDAENRMLAQTAPYTAQYTASAPLVALAQEACSALGVRNIVGKIATGDQFIGDKATKARITQACHPHCVEMEGAAVAQVCMRNNLPFVVVRAMSDNSDTSVEVLGAEAFDVSSYVQTAASIVLYMLNKIS